MEKDKEKTLHSDEMSWGAVADRVNALKQTLITQRNRSLAEDMLAGNLDNVSIDVRRNMLNLQMNQRYAKLWLLEEAVAKAMVRLEQESESLARLIPA